MYCKRTAFISMLAAACVALAPASAQTAPAGPAPAPMDLHTGKTDAASLSYGPYGLEAGFPLSPPQLVEGTLVSMDKATKVAVVRTAHDGEVKIGLPDNVVLSREGQTEGCTLDQIQVGDRVYATVVTVNGNRALRIVSEPPASPLRDIVGIPVLCLLALWIWRIRCKPNPHAQLAAKAA